MKPVLALAITLCAAMGATAQPFGAFTLPVVILILLALGAWYEWRCTHGQRHRRTR